jgi:hypothetical protein
MATQIKSQSGNNNVYTITDELGITATVTVGFVTAGSGRNTTIATTGLHDDGVQMLSNLLIQLASGVQP